MKEKSSLTAAYLNTVYCTDGRSLYGFLRTHYHHLRRHDEKIAEYADPNIALRFVRKTDYPDVVVLAEILGSKQRDQVSRLLCMNGYYHIHYGAGQRANGIDGHDGIILATKMPSIGIELPDLVHQKADQHGNGGGLVAAHLPDLDCTVSAGHLPFPSRKECYAEQIGALKDVMKSARDRCRMVMGDFNMTPERLRGEHPGLVEGMKLLTPNAPTCSTVVGIEEVYSECLDQAWGSGFDVIESHTVLDQSDHMGLHMNLKPQ